jgi:outer membrane receptor protein involved in Fe transport
MLSESNAIFARASQGYVGNAERAVWHQGGPYLENKAPKNSLFQAELGYKKQFKNGGLFVTGFYAKTEEEAGVEATTQNVLSNDYSSFGVELESFMKIKSFDIRGAITYVKAEIVDNDGDVNIGNTPRRQPGLSYNILPSYNFKGGHILGVSVIGQTSSYAQDNNVLKMPGYAIFNAFLSLNIAKGLSVNLNVNNLTNTLGITESEEGAIIDNQTNYVRARSISGRSIVGGIVFNF